MGKLAQLGVGFANNQDVFKPGDVVSGIVVMKLNEEKGDIRSIQVTCTGTAQTRWTEQEGSGDHKRTVTYKWVIPLFAFQQNVGEALKSNKDRIVLPAGEHHFPFQFQLPNKPLPPPVEGGVGWVRYCVKITIDRPWKFDHHASRYFTVLADNDLRQVPGAEMPQDGADEKTVCCLCCASGPIRVTASTDKSGYVPGERVRFSVKVENNSSRDILSLKAVLLQSFVFRAKRGARTHTRTRSERKAVISRAGCGPMDSVYYQDQQLFIPPLAPNGRVFDLCPNIDVFYYIQLEADVSGTPLDAKLRLPVSIGTIPCRASHFNHPHPLARPPPQGHPAAVQPPPGYTPMPPPQAVTSQPQHQAYPPQGQPYPSASPQGQAYPSAIPQGQAHAPAPAASQGQHAHPPSGHFPLASNKVHPSNEPSQPPPLTSQGPQSAPGAEPAEYGYQPNIHEGAPLDDLPPPPTYEMSVGGPQQMPAEEGNFGTIMYAPRYPFFNYGDSLHELQTFQLPDEPITTQPHSSAK